MLDKVQKLPEEQNPENDHQDLKNSLTTWTTLQMSRVLQTYLKDAVLLTLQLVTQISVFFLQFIHLFL